MGFFLRLDGSQLLLLGGNQLDEVREHAYPASSVLAYRWPSGWPGQRLTAASTAG